ncbi:MAG TPA: hypothetical protein VGY55_24480 [Pirellulales bacterium]|nr:hypothetical protein [Pirellulales bacterium]
MKDEFNLFDAVAARLVELARRPIVSLRNNLGMLETARDKFALCSIDQTPAKVSAPCGGRHCEQTDISAAILFSESNHPSDRSR